MELVFFSDARRGTALNRSVAGLSSICASEISWEVRSRRRSGLLTYPEGVAPADLVEAKTAALRTIAELVEQRDDVDNALLNAIRDARHANRSWSEIGAMLGVSKQAAQRKYAAKLSA